jgi:maleate isomerase
MSTLEEAVVSRCRAEETKGRIGLIVPSSNRLAEPQFHRYAPAGIAIHVARVQITGRHRRPIGAMLDEIGHAASSLGDARCDPVVFHCTGTAMTEGAEGEAAIVARVARESGATSFSVAQAILEAFGPLGMRRVVLLSPYSTNEHEKSFLRAHGIEVVSDIALNVGTSDGYITIPVARWVELAREHARVPADGYFLSCTNTTQIEAIAAIEQETGKPVVNSNQATLWAALRRINSTGAVPELPSLGKLFAPAGREAPSPRYAGRRLG